jgi:putative membrane protein
MLALLALAAAWAGRAAGSAGGGERAALALGWATLALALLSPLCSLSVALFSARVGQHLLLTLVAAPLIAIGLGASRKGRGAPGVALPTLAFALALWGRHLPGPYAATFADDAAYWAMHASLFGAALWLWRAMRLRAARRPDAAALAGLATAAQMGALGALLTFAPRPLFAAHAATTTPWGLSPLEDQQLGGLPMWVPGGLLFAAPMVLGAVLALRATEDAAERARESAPAPAAR